MTVEQIGGKPRCVCGRGSFLMVPSDRWPERNEYELECMDCGAVMVWRDPMPMAEVLDEPTGAFSEVE